LFYWSTAVFIVLLNLVAFIHAYKFTHFSNAADVRTRDPTELSISDKLETLVFGIHNPRPTHRSIPNLPYSTIKIGQPNTISCWQINVDNPRGVVILFHGYAGNKSQLLARSKSFIAFGYNVLLVDFLGSGDSEGNVTSVGFKEATQVKSCYDFVAKETHQPIYLFGTSMGAAAIMKAMHDYPLKPNGIILECPFGSLYKTVCARFKNMGVPPFPMAALLAFWGGVQNGYWAFSHNPERYATSIKCDVLLLYGQRDDRVSFEEIKAIYSNFGGYKILKTYPAEGHDVFTPPNVSQWERDVSQFLGPDINAHELTSVSQWYIDQ